MVLEATVICVDNSDYMRNGDYVPTRLYAQQDAAGLICGSKRQSNPENTVGLMTLAKPKVLVTLTSETGKILAALNQVQPKGNISFITSVRIAHLALRHRQSRNQKMRIVVFVGSPIDEDEKELVRLGKRLKKEKVSIDVVNFGEEELNQEKLSVFVDTVNGKDGSSSHLVTVPPGTMLHDALMSSPVILGEDGSGAIPGIGMEFGVDPNEDPELALALRVSMEDQRARQEAEATARNAVSETGGTGTEAPGGLATSTGTTEDALLQEALALSMQQEAEAAAATQPVPAQAMDSSVDLSNMSEEEQIAYALQMSLQHAKELQEKDDDGKDSMEVDPKSQEEAGDKSGTDVGQETTEIDSNFLRSVLGQLPGVDPQSEEVRSAVERAAGHHSTTEKMDEDDDKKSKE